MKTPFYQLILSVCFVLVVTIVQAQTFVPAIVNEDPLTGNPLFVNNTGNDILYDINSDYTFQVTVWDATTSSGAGISWIVDDKT